MLDSEEDSMKRLKHLTGRQQARKLPQSVGVSDTGEYTLTHFTRIVSEFVLDGPTLVADNLESIFFIPLKSFSCKLKY